MIFIEGPRVISPFSSGLGVARPRSEPRLLCFSGHWLSAIRASTLPDPGCRLARPGHPIVPGSCFLDPPATGFYGDWDQTANDLVAILRTGLGGDAQPAATPAKPASTGQPDPRRARRAQAG
jgi:hypothetical protein